MPVQEHARSNLSPVRKPGSSEFGPCNMSYSYSFIFLDSSHNCSPVILKHCASAHSGRISAYGLRNTYTHTHSFLSYLLLNRLSLLCSVHTVHFSVVCLGLCTCTVIPSILVIHPRRVPLHLRSPPSLLSTGSAFK